MDLIVLPNLLIEFSILSIFLHIIFSNDEGYVLIIEGAEIKDESNKAFLKKAI